MILVTVGTMLPFDRLIEATDKWAESHRNEEVVAQIGEHAVYEPKHMHWTRRLEQQEFAGLVERCRLLIAHAGTGSFFLAAEKSRPIVLLPRQARFNEHTTDHQLHTARWLCKMPGVYVAMTTDELAEAISKALSAPNAFVKSLSSYASNEFLSKLRHALLE